MELDALIAAVGDERLNPRFVRFLISEGILPPPGGSRTRPDYGADHERRCRAYFFLRDHGFSVEQIRLLAAGDAEGAYPVAIAPGVILHLNPGNFATPPDPDAIARSIAVALRHLSALAPAKE